MSRFVFSTKDAACLLLALALCGCLGLKPVEDTTRTYILNSPAPKGETMAQPKGLRIGFSGVELPSYLLQSSIVHREGENELVPVPNAIWAEKLDQGIPRVLGESWLRAGQAARVYDSEWGRGEVDVQVFLQILRFEADDEGRLVLEALWEVSAAGAGAKDQPTRTSRIEKKVAEGPANAASLVEAMGQALLQLSQEIASGWTVR